jgi:hypothetical protein
MVRGILADHNVRGQVNYLLAIIEAPPWNEFWEDLGLAQLHFEDVGLAPESSDLDVWLRCQTEGLVLITANRNYKGSDSLEATLRSHNGPTSLPVFTIADIDKLITTDLTPTWSRKRCWIICSGLRSCAARGDCSFPELCSKLSVAARFLSNDIFLVFLWGNCHNPGNPEDAFDVA